jgi:hypothetical protein
LRKCREEDPNVDWPMFAVRLPPRPGEAAGASSNGGLPVARLAGEGSVYLVDDAIPTVTLQEAEAAEGTAAREGEEETEEETAVEEEPEVEPTRVAEAGATVEEGSNRAVVEKDETPRAASEAVAQTEAEAEALAEIEGEIEEPVKSKMQMALSALNDYGDTKV